MSVPLTNFNGTDVWFIPGAPINSTEAFNHASRLEERAYIANRYLFVAIMVVMLGFVALAMPHAFLRAKASPRWYWGASLLRAPRPTPGNGAIPKSLAHLPRLLPPRIIPILGLTWTEAGLVFVLWVTSVGVAAWCQASFLTDASRSTLVVMALMALTAGLGVKSGGVGTWVVRGYTALNFLHRWCGRLVWLLSTLHVVAYLVIFYRAGIARAEMAKPENYLAAVAYAGLCLTALGSIRPIRQRHWLVFKSCHHGGVLLLVGGLNYHSPNIVSYLLAIWILFVLDAMFRSLTTRMIIPTLVPLAAPESTLFRIGKRTGYIPGQHVRVRVLSGLGLGWNCWMESHPFTIASANGDELELIMKVSGDWTRQVHNAALEGRQLRCTIEGPYGGPINFIFPAFQSVAIIAGGSGISFGLGVVRGLLSEVREGRAACTQIVLVWTAKSYGHIAALAPQLDQLVNEIRKSDAPNQCRLKLVLCYTQGTAEEEIVDDKDNPDEKARPYIKPRISSLPDSSVQQIILPHRPDIPAILKDLTDTTPDGTRGIGVGVCGPVALVENVQSIVWHWDRKDRKRVGGIEVHAERFSL